MTVTELQIGFMHEKRIIEFVLSLEHCRKITMLKEGCKKITMLKEGC